MARPDGWPVVSGLQTPESWFGLRFLDPTVEEEYQTWRREHIHGFARVAMYAAAGAAVCAWIAVAFGALEDLRTTALILIPLMIVVLFTGAAVLTADRSGRQVNRWSGGVNLIGGALAVAMTSQAESPELTGACVTMAAYFGLTMFRLPPRVAAVSVPPYVLAAIVLTGDWYRRDVIEQTDLVLGIFIPGTALLTGLALNLAIEWLTRQTYLDHLIIEAQQEALVEERAAMARFVSPDIAETAHLSGWAETHPEIYSLTAVNIDLRGFTTFTQRHGAEFMVQVLQEYYAAVIEAAAEHGATVKDFAGDGALILVGAPFSRSDHTRVGLRLARDLMARAREVTSHWTTPETPLGAGIGIASGECAVGAIGTATQLEYAAIGTTINLSARLCSIAQDGEILMSASTARSLEESPGWERKVLTLAGIREPVEVTVEDTLAPAADLTTPGTAPLPTTQPVRPTADGSADYDD